MKATKKSKKLKLLKGEKFMYVLLVVMILMVPIFNVFTSSLLSSTNTELERLKSKINKQELANKSLHMQVDELTSLENIQAIAEEYSLSYNNGNIKTIGE